mmetsp:Transcript_86156/g.129126  ORF Transcript_86156/g.129126 Transcript_86156/m.129126 type:complete len:301 (+) Transcript_86156:401-1303(+)
MLSTVRFEFDGMNRLSRPKSLVESVDHVAAVLMFRYLKFFVEFLELFVELSGLFFYLFHELLDHFEDFRAFRVGEDVAVAVGLSLFVLLGRCCGCGSSVGSSRRRLLKLFGDGFELRPCRFQDFFLLLLNGMVGMFRLLPMDRFVSVKEASITTVGHYRHHVVTIRTAVFQSSHFHFLLQSYQLELHFRYDPNRMKNRLAFETKGFDGDSQNDSGQTIRIPKLNTQFDFVHIRWMLARPTGFGGTIVVWRIPNGFGRNHQGVQDRHRLNVCNTVSLVSFSVTLSFKWQTQLLTVQSLFQW